MLPKLYTFFNSLMSPSSSSKHLHAKTRRKKQPVDVIPTVHREDEEISSVVDQKEHKEKVRKTYGATFTAKKHRHHQHQVDENLQKLPVEQDLLNQKLCRRYLSKENQKLIREKEEILSKFLELEELSVKKITTLKEQIVSLESANDSAANENQVLQEQCQELLGKIEELSYSLELSRNCKSCEELKKTVEKLEEDKLQLHKNKQELEEDLFMLKNVVYRLNVQLERYQEKLRQHGTAMQPTQQNTVSNADSGIGHLLGNFSGGDLPFLGESHKDHTHTPVSWGKVNVHTLGPLLDGYQDTIAEKDEIIQSYETELFNFTGKLKEILKENERLHQSLTEDEECSANLKKTLEKTRKELKVIKDQNDLLIKKCAMDKDKLDEVLKVYETKIEQLRRDYSVLHEQYCKSRTEVAALKERNKSLESYQDNFKNDMQNYIPVAVHTASVNECKKWYEELKSQYELEKTKQARVIEKLEEQVSNLTKEKESLENRIKQLDKIIKKGEARLLEMEHTLNEVQLSKSACRKQLHKAMSFAKELVAEQETLLNALNQRQMENKAVRKMSSDIASRMDQLKTQLKDVQRDAYKELNTVELKIQEQNEVIETMKQEHTEEIERLQKIIREQEEQGKLLTLGRHHHQSQQGAGPDTLSTQKIAVSHYMHFREKYK